MNEQITKHKYSVGGLTLIWEWNEEETNARNIKDNNLYIEGIWNMSDTLKRTDACVGVTITGDNTFSFVTFTCIRYSIAVSNGKIELVSKQITK